MLSPEEDVYGRPSGQGWAVAATGEDDLLREPAQPGPRGQVGTAASAVADFEDQLVGVPGPLIAAVAASLWRMRLVRVAVSTK